MKRPSLKPFFVFEAGKETTEEASSYAGCGEEEGNWRVSSAKNDPGGEAAQTAGRRIRKGGRAAQRAAIPSSRHARSRSLRHFIIEIRFRHRRFNRNGDVKL